MELNVPEHGPLLVLWPGLCSLFCPLCASWSPRSPAWGPSPSPRTAGAARSSSGRSASQCWTETTILLSVETSGCNLICIPFLFIRKMTKWLLVETSGWDFVDCNCYLLEKMTIWLSVETSGCNLICIPFLFIRKMTKWLLVETSGWDFVDCNCYLLEKMTMWLSVEASARNFMDSNWYLLENK